MKKRVMNVPFLTIYVVVTFTSFVSGHIIDASSNSPVVRGATIQFKVEIFKNDGTPAYGKFRYIWKDLLDPNRNATITSSSPVCHWNLTCDSKCAPGKYGVQVTIMEDYFIIYSTIWNKTINYEVTKMLNGDLILQQGSYNRTDYVNSASPLNQSIVLKQSDLDFMKSKNFIRSFWFIDCIYYDQVNGYQYDFNFSKADSKHLIEVLLVGTTLPVNESQVNPIATNSTGPNNGTVASSENSMEAEFWNKSKLFHEWLIDFNKTHPKGNTTFNPSGICLNISSIPLGDNYTYGLFRTNFTVKDPVKMSPINGTNWLKDGEILNITVSCTGSPPYKYCYFMRLGLYNVTGNEVCPQEQLTKNCSFNIQHFFKRSPEYTVVVFISNSVSKVIKPIGVIIYESTRHPQLSVIIVPVGFSIVAVILIIFGVAHHVQSRRRCTVEVANFDFTNHSSDMEYKTFRERLRESVSHLFLKSNDFDDEEEERDERVWSPSRKYGSMQ